MIPEVSRQIGDDRVKGKKINLPFYFGEAEEWEDRYKPDKVFKKEDEGRSYQT
jgi:hypothetical protein